MKKHIFFAILAALSLCLVSCNQNTPDDTKKGGDTPTSQHQPANPATWSPVGKMYVCDRSSDNPYDYDYFMHVIYFFSKDSALSYGTTNRDLSPMPEQPYYTPSAYRISYPNVTFIMGADDGIGIFSDTLTLTTSYVHHLLQN